MDLVAANLWAHSSRGYHDYQKYDGAGLTTVCIGVGIVFVSFLVLNSAGLVAVALPNPETIREVGLPIRVYLFIGNTATMFKGCN